MQKNKVSTLIKMEYSFWDLFSNSRFSFLLKKKYVNLMISVDHLPHSRRNKHRSPSLRPAKPNMTACITP